ncbi:hypothetical protein LCGC14_2903340 [marine sediment metagenome]|uniref:Uncharacterized protein n=1 Tax=marine sediment metagenome TaxID=412755 RepID=A0A0F9A1J9_9ZZZZ
MSDDEKTGGYEGVSRNPLIQTPDKREETVSKPLRKKGRPKISLEQKKRNVVRVYFSDAEFQQLKEKRGFNSFSGYLRTQGLSEGTYSRGAGIVRVKRDEIIKQGEASGLGAVVREMKNNILNGIDTLQKLEDIIITEPTEEELIKLQKKAAATEKKIYQKIKAKKGKIKLQKLTPPKGVSP